MPKELDLDSSERSKARKEGKGLAFRTLGPRVTSNCRDWISHYHFLTSSLIYKEIGKNTNNLTGEWEHIVVSYIKQVIPESVQEFWHSWRSSMKKAASNQERSEQTEPAGWGVEEADAMYKKEASTSPFSFLEILAS